MRPLPRKSRRAGRLTLGLGLGGALLGGALALTRCFVPDLPACSYICAKEGTEPRCPDEYECRMDGYCHLRGSTEACPYSMDLGPDAAQPRPDLATAAADLSPVDAQGDARTD